MRLPKHAELWLPGLIQDRLARRLHPPEPVTHLWLMIGDHYEPCWNRPDGTTARSRVQAWAERWPRIADHHRDHFDRPAQYTFFYPQEEYRPALLDPLAQMTRDGIADVEVHIHHHNDTEAGFVEKMSGFIQTLRHEHGLLREVNGQPSFGFIHGNWALDNSRPDGHWCGINNELTLLRKLGCYADFTLPAAPDPCQTRQVNSIYWAVDDPRAPRSHDRGIPVLPGGTPPADSLLMVQGPLALRWPRDRWPKPALDAGELAGHDPVTPDRVRAWFDHAPQVGTHRFLKLHAHGAPEKNAEPLLGRDLDQLFALARAGAHARGWKLVHATAWQVATAIEALVRGEEPRLLHGE